MGGVIHDPQRNETSFKLVFFCPHEELLEELLLPSDSTSQTALKVSARVQFDFRLDSTGTQRVTGLCSLSFPGDDDPVF
jgi:hypothetical protein